MPQRVSKVVSLEEAASRIPDGSTISVGGISYHGAPMSLVRALVRRKARDLTLITAAVTSVQADLLIAAGCVRKIISPYVAFEELGLAPNFRRAVEQGCIELLEIGEAFLGYGLKAAASGAPYYPLPLKLAASDCATVNRCYKLARNPFDDSEILCIPALKADFALLHARRADQFGNLQHHSSAFMDPLLAEASERVLATTDELVDHVQVRHSSYSTTIPAFRVAAVVPLPGAARPTAAFGSYDVDRKELKRYLAASRKAETLAAYLDGLGTDESAYLERLGPAPSFRSEVQEVAHPAPHAPPAPAEIIATVIARSVRDGMFTGAGTGCWEVAAGLRLAQLTHAPNLCFTMGGSGAVNPELASLPLSLNSDEPLGACEALVGLPALLDLELRGAFDILFASGLQVDRFGNVNLASLGPADRPKFRGPGTVGLEFAPCATEMVLFFRSHTSQVFVEKVDFISGIGFNRGPGSRSRWGLDDAGGPKLVVSNLAVMDFDPATLSMRLQSVHPGVSVDQVKQNTGFELLIPEQVPTTELPTAEELALLRSRIDRTGLLFGLISETS